MWIIIGIVLIVFSNWGMKKTKTFAITYAIGILFVFLGIVSLLIN